MHRRSFLFFYVPLPRSISAYALALLSFFAVIFCAGTPAYAAKKPNHKYAAIIMDADTGQILSQSNADRKLHPASLTKVMTLILTFDAINQGKLSLNDRIKISRTAASMQPSKLGLKAGSTIRVRDAIYAVVTKSANDIAVALAEHLGESEQKFAKMMTTRARQMGMTSTVFMNASGLHNPGQISTARDMAKMAQVLINEYPSYYSYFSTKNFTYAGQHYHNHNRLMSSYKGMDGLKTGYVSASGFNLIASAVRDNRRLIGVVFGGRTAASRNAQMASLLDQGFGALKKQGGSVLVAQGKDAAAPVPPRKPNILLAMQKLNDVAPTGGAATDAGTVDSASLTLAEQNILEAGGFGEVIGQGDYDITVSKRVETGLMAIAALKGDVHTLKPSPAVQKTKMPAKTMIGALSFKSPAESFGLNAKGWAIQVGAFTSRAITDQRLAKAQKKLPQNLAGQPMIAPLRTNEGWLYRARLAGYTKEQAFAACQKLADCLPVAPQH